MRGTTGRVLTAFGIALVSVALLPAGAAAVVTGKCTATQEGSSSTVDLNKDEVWHLKKADTITGQGASEPELNGVKVSAVNLGVPLPVYTSPDKGHGGSTDRSYHVADYSQFSRIVYVSGTAGDGACTGHIKVVVDDQSAVTNLASLAAIALMVLGLILLLLALLSSSGGFGVRLLGAIGGLLFGLGLAILFEELEILDPAAIAGLAFPILGLILGFLLGGLRLRGRPAAPAAA